VDTGEARGVHGSTMQDYDCGHEVLLGMVCDVANSTLFYPPSEFDLLFHLFYFFLLVAGFQSNGADLMVVFPLAAV